jgi:hypothetical protein
MVTIEIGSKRKKYHLSQALLVRHSSYFRRTLPTSVKTSSEHKVAIEDLSPCAFDVFVAWLHTGKTPQTNHDWVPQPAGMLPHDYDLHTSLLRLKTYVVADRLGVQAFLQAVNNNYIDNNLTAPWLAEVIFAYKHISHDRRILQMMVDAHCSASILRSDFADDEDELQHKLPTEFLLRVLDRYAELRHLTDYRDDERSLVKCDYHEHANEEERVECRAQEIWERGFDEDQMM